MKKKLIIILGVVVSIILVLGVKFYMDEKKLNEEMIKVVYSYEAKKVFEERLVNLDPKAFTEEGIIHSYEIDEESIEHNPMGGIEVRLIINKDSEMYVSYTMSKYNGKLSGGGVVISKELAKQTGIGDGGK
ncbi:DUF1310 domain-containing protein [Listeria seeligeri]|uniref:DUF1310 family protein n=1 Tax=Listeria seeligeri TaxID=1640 RepID=UPI001624A37E|nr:DUF1310 family protein [Listeria seeligeri]MBC1420416.1 DUF1310 domain-containing protein [Listeria seeligeri]MBC1750120.1 DUF1310 domain-containing protein [Listeria seeligeri]MBC1753516.1 DUF1310 domain-containing protein [Listeria seeligeri]MBC1787063.1 DUF1310 domain-containing protein [Listeria seeligeri]MBC1828554.1 DUF1310 domain-containing protein [Listeria seeligeri]